MAPEPARSENASHVQFFCEKREASKKHITKRYQKNTWQQSFLDVCYPGPPLLFKNISTKSRKGKSSRCLPSWAPWRCWHAMTHRLFLLRKWKSWRQWLLQLLRFGNLCVNTHVYLTLSNCLLIYVGMQAVGPVHVRTCVSILGMGDSWLTGCRVATGRTHQSFSKFCQLALLTQTIVLKKK